MLDEPDEKSDVTQDVEPVAEPVVEPVAEHDSADKAADADYSPRSRSQTEFGPEDSDEQEAEQDSSLDIAEGGLIARLNLREYNEDAKKNHDEIKEIVEEIHKNKLEQKKDKSGNVEHLQNGKSVLSERKTKDGISFSPTADTNETLTVSIPHKNPDGTLSKEHFDVIEINKDGTIENFRSANLRVADDGSIEKGHDTRTTSQLDMKWLQASLQKSRSGAKVVGHEVESGARVVAQAEDVQEQDAQYTAPLRDDAAPMGGAYGPDAEAQTELRAFTPEDRKQFAAAAASLRTAGMTSDSSATKAGPATQTPAVEAAKGQSGQSR